MPGEALHLLRRLVERPDHVFWPDDVAIATSEFVARERLIGHGQITDAQLLALALRHGGRLVTFDRGISQLVPRGFDPEEVLELLSSAS